MLLNVEYLGFIHQGLAIRVGLCRSRLVLRFVKLWMCDVGGIFLSFGPSQFFSQLSFAYKILLDFFY